MIPVPIMKLLHHVSVHGGHSGQFCFHARDTLEEMVRHYADAGYAWVGITEHIPPQDNAFLYPDQKEAGFDAAGLLALFGDYITECRRLQKAFRDRLTLYVGFETETVPGYRTWVPELIRRYRPDYIVGSVHHVDGVGFDFSPEDYAAAIERAGGLENLYVRYFDLQHEMIATLKPAVVGHFDLIRIFDPEYPKHISLPRVWDRILRNLHLVGQLGLILDFNLRALSKGAPEPYITKPILETAARMNLKVVPGDDAHGITDIDACMARGIQILASAGVSTDWPMPDVYGPAGN